MKKQNRIVCSLLCSAATALLPSFLSAQNNYWMVENGLWSEGANWKGGVPVAPDAPASAPASSNATFAVFSDNYQGAQSATIDADAQINQLQIGYGQSANLNLINGSNLTLRNSLIVAGGYGDGTGVSSLRLSATDAADVSNVNLALVVVGFHQNGADGNALTFEGAGLRVNSTAQVRVGSARSNNSLKLKDGAHFAVSSQIIVGHAASRSSTAQGNNNTLSVEGAGTRLTATSATASALLVGSTAVSSDTSPISGNRADVTAGAFMRAESSASTAATVQVGATRYSRSSVLNVSGADSRLEVGSTNGFGIMIGASNAQGTGFNDNRDNRVIVSNGGVIKNEGSTQISNTFGSSQNYLRVGSGGSYLASDDINNRGGIVYLDNGGVISGQSVDGSASKVIVINLLNNTTYNPSTLYAEGSGLGASVNVNADAGSIVSIGNAANNSVEALELNSQIQMAEGSTLRFLIFSGSNGGRIDFGATGSLSGAATLAISFAGYTARAGDEWVLFSGNTQGIDPSFLLSTSDLPGLSDGLHWDLSRLNSNDGWVLGVVPEPRSSAMAAGGVVLTFALLAKRRLAKKSS